jgi:hypothetical protein
MRKYWLCLALFGGLGCAVTPAENGAATQAAVTDKTATDGAKGSASAGSAGTTKGDCDPGSKTTPPPSANGVCDQELADIQLALKSTTDPQQIKALLDKLEAIKLSCAAPPPNPKPDPCAAELAVIQADLEDALKAGDTARATADKEKLAAVAASCSAGDKQPDPCAAELAAGQQNLDAAIASGDPAQISAAKEKLAAIASSCSPANGDKDP